MKPTALVVGDTLAGLTAALRLTQQDFTVTVLPLQDCSPLDEPCDPGLPFVVMGCDVATHSLLELLGTHAQIASNNATLEFSTDKCRLLRLRRPRLPAPLDVMASIAVFPGLSARDRWRFLVWMERTWEQDPALPIDLDSHTAEAWLRSIGQSEFARTHVWTPLSRFLLGDEVKVISAASLLHTLIRCFLWGSRRAQITIPHSSLTSLLHEPLRSLLVARGVIFQTGCIDHLQFDINGVSGAHMKGERILAADRYILALPHHQVSSLLRERILTKFSYFQQLADLTDSPAVTLHLRIEHTISSSGIVLLAGKSFHWLCVQPDSSRNGTRISLVARGQAGLLERSDEEWLNEAHILLKHTFPSLPQAAVGPPGVMRSARATLSNRPGTASHRPLQQSPFANLFLVGEWTDTGYPSTIESAIVSGHQCADAILGVGLKK
jgi:uncharacterized protein with NAD-binding domain and iron-sulfur cluster